MPDGQADYVCRCIIIAPDYEGYGVTKDTPHPYLSQRVTAQQMLDAIKYGLELYQQVSKGNATLLPMKSNWRSFCMGYSQGGAVALATHREIEEQRLADELHFQGSLCGDGPYDLITTMRYYLEDDGTSYGVETSHHKGKVTLPVVLPLILKGMFETYPDMKAYKIEDFLSQQLIDTGVLDWIDSKTYTTAEIGEKWYKQLQTGIDTLGRHYTPEQMAELFESPDKNKVWGKVEKMLSPAVYEYMSDAGASFLMTLLAAKGYGAYFNWICEGGTPTGIAEIGDVRGKMSEVWYTLDGRRLNDRPTQKGVYIHQGKSIVIR